LFLQGLPSVLKGKFLIIKFVYKINTMGVHKTKVISIRVSAEKYIDIFQKSLAQGKSVNAYILNNLDELALKVEELENKIKALKDDKPNYDDDGNKINYYDADGKRIIYQDDDGKKMIYL